MNNLRIHCIADPQKLAEKLADQIVDSLEQAILARGKATLVVSGGSTPKSLFNILSRQKLAWNLVTVTLADERCVEPDDEQSNARLVRENLLINEAAEAKFVSLFDGGPAEQSAADDASIKLSHLPTYDAVILGMGNDGHTASIFPEAENRDAALSPDQACRALLIDPVTVAPLRITQTAKRLLDTRFLALHIIGKDKANLLHSIILNPDEKQWPIAHFICQQNVSLNIYTDVSH